MDFSHLSLLSNPQLLARLEELARAERRNLPHFLACLAIADDRLAHREPGFPSLFEFCTLKLRYSEDEAYRRIHAARAANRYSDIYSMLSNGSLSLSVVSKLAPHLTSENATALLQRAQGKSKRAVEEMLAAEFPRPETVDRIRPIKVSPLPMQPAAPSPTSGLAPASDQAPSPPAEALAAPAQTSMAAVQASLDRFEFNFTGSRELRDAINRLKDLLWHKYPWGRLEDVIHEACSEYLKRHDPQLRLAVHERRIGQSHGRSIPAWVRRAVWGRDQGRCSYIAADGHRCQTRRGLEYDHKLPFAKGGRSDDPGNIRLLCRAHNDHERRKVFGG